MNIEIVYSFHDNYHNLLQIASTDTFQEIYDIPDYDNISYLSVACNYLTSLPRLPKNLKSLHCNYNNIKRLPELPDGLEELICHTNELTELPQLPNTIRRIYCFQNKLTSLPKLPDSLIELYCYDNYLTKLPEFPNSLCELACAFNDIEYIPKIPESCNKINISYNKLTEIPNIPIGVKNFNCIKNQINKLPIIFKKTNLNNVFISDNPIYDYILMYFDGDIKKYIEWNNIIYSRFANKIENWFLECKYNPKYKYCQKFVMMGYNDYIAGYNEIMTN